MLGYQSAGFLAYLGSDTEAGSLLAIPFDMVQYNAGNNYNPETGIFTVPISGSYLITARVYGSSYNAGHWIKIDKLRALLTANYDPDVKLASASTTIVLHLQKGQELSVDSTGSGSTLLAGWRGYEKSSFGANLLYPD